MCGKGFISSSHIKSHMKSHNTENLNPWALCGRKFKSRNNSKIHSKRNTGLWYMHNCTLCGKGIISGNHTKRHIQSLARENLWQCVFCGKKLMFEKVNWNKTKLKGTKNIELNVQRSKTSQNIKKKYWDIFFTQFYYFMSSWTNLEKMA